MNLALLNVCPFFSSSSISSIFPSFFLIITPLNTYAVSSATGRAPLDTKYSIGLFISIFKSYLRLLKKVIVFFYNNFP